MKNTNSSLGELQAHSLEDATWQVLSPEKRIVSGCERLLEQLSQANISKKKKRHRRHRNYKILNKILQSSRKETKTPIS